MCWMLSSNPDLVTMHCPCAVDINKSGYLDKLVPASRDNDGVGGDRAEAHA